MPALPAIPALPRLPCLPRVTIALCTYNGAAHLQAQLDSYLAQQHQDWDLWVSDDGSEDATLAILERFRAQQAGRRQVRVLRGPGRGPAANYLSLLCHPALPAAPVALSDQDDVWFPEKLSRALLQLDQAAPLALYGGQSLHADAALVPTGTSRPPRRPPCFENALTQNIVSGHSATLSAAALQLVRQAGRPEAVPYHDWWLYQLISGAGGAVLIDRAPVLYYRQHRNNAMGAHQGINATLTRFSQLFGRTYGGWIASNLQALAQVADLLTPPHRQIVTRLLLQPRGRGRLRALQGAGLHRQSRADNLAFYLAAALGRI